MEFKQAKELETGFDEIIEVFEAILIQPRQLASLEFFKLLDMNRNLFHLLSDYSKGEDLCGFAIEC